MSDSVKLPLALKGDRPWFLADAEVEAFRPSDEDARALDEWRANFVRSVLRPTQAEMARTKAGATEPCDAAIELEEAR